MSANGDEAVTLLRSIDASLKQLVGLLRVAKPKAVASDRDLDSQWGDPTIKMADPRDWTGPPMKGRRFSECPSEYLEMLADRFDYFADQAEAKNELYNGKPVAPYRRTDAARARGWAKRVREGYRGAAASFSGNGNGHAAADSFSATPALASEFGTPDNTPLTDDDIPFMWALPFIVPALLAVRLFA